MTRITEITLKRVYPDDGEDMAIEVIYPNQFRGWRKFVGGDSHDLATVLNRVQEALNTLGLAADYQIVETPHDLL